MNRLSLSPSSRTDLLRWRRSTPPPASDAGTLESPSGNLAVQRALAARSEDSFQRGATAVSLAPVLQALARLATHAQALQLASTRGRHLGRLRPRRRPLDKRRASKNHDHRRSPRPAGRNGRLPRSALKSIGGGKLLAGRAADAFNRMRRAAARDGVTLKVNSAYRSIADQKRMVRKYGLYSRGGRAAAPGRSNHGWGLSVDISVKNDSRARAWLRKNAHRFGFRNDVPREPWHWTYQTK